MVLPSGLMANSRGNEPVGIWPRLACSPRMTASTSTTDSPVVALPYREGPELAKRFELAVRIRRSFAPANTRPTGEVPTWMEASNAAL